MCFSTFSQLISLRFTSAACRDAAAEGVGGGDANLSPGLLCRENIWIISCLFVCLLITWGLMGTLLSLTCHADSGICLIWAVNCLSFQRLPYYITCKEGWLSKQRFDIWELCNYRLHVGISLIYLCGWWGEHHFYCCSYIGLGDCSNITLHQGVTACWWSTK